MKYFIWTLTNDQKKDQAVQLRLFAALFIFMIFMLGTFAIYLQIVGEKMSAHSSSQFMFFIFLMLHIIGIAPNIMKYSWKQIIIISSGRAIVIGIFFAVTLGIF